ncbi:MAG: hypothetical protein ABIK28_10485 [Planctomycetota bacterium]
MHYRFFCCLSSLFLVSFFVSAQADNISLSYQKADIEPGFNYAFNLESNESLSWKQPSPPLSSRAWTQEVTLGSVMDMNAESFLLSMDVTREEGLRPDTLYIDLNKNEALDDNERFDLKPLHSGAYILEYNGPLLYAEKVPLPLSSGKTVFINLFIQLPPEEGDEKAMKIRIGTSAWGWFEGKATVQGDPYRIIGIDRTLNGSFSDFREQNSVNFDGIAFVPAAAKAKEAVSSHIMSLRQALLIDGKAYQCKIEGEGETLVIEPMNVASGSVTFKPAGLKVYLSNETWGIQRLDSGASRALPEGTWNVNFFYEQSGANESYFGAPSGMTLEVISGKDTELALSTRLEASIKAREKKGELSLSLKLLTDQGSTLKGYRAGHKEMKGVPFRLFDGTGKLLHEASFAFG